MTTDLFLGGLASLILAAIVIVTLTANRREDASKSHKGAARFHSRGSDVSGR